MNLIARLPGQRRTAIMLCGAASVLVSSTAIAADATWDGGGGDANWSTGTNWAGDIAPLAGDRLIFDGAAGLTATNDYTAGTAFGDVVFNAGAGAFNVGGNSILVGGNISNQSLVSQSLGLGISLGTGKHTVTGSTTAGAILGLANIAPTTTSVAVFTPNTGTITTTSTNTNGILGGWASVGTTTGGANWATVNGSNQIVAYSGYTVVAAAGAIASDATSNVRTSGTSTVTGTVDINTLKAFTTGGTGGNDITIAAGGTLRFGTMGGILHDNAAANNMRIGSNTAGVGNNTITAGGPVSGTAGTLVINTVATASSHNNVVGILGTITDNGSGVVTVVKTGLTSAYFDAGNSYSGGTYIYEGHIQGNRATSFGTGDIHVSSGGQAYLNATATFANNLFITGTGPTVDNVGAMRLSNATLTGVLTLEGDSRINTNGNAAPFLNGKITGDHALELYGTGTGTTTATLSNTNNDYSGNLTLTASSANYTSSLVLGNSEVIAHGIGKGNLILNASGSGTASATLNLNGKNETINALISSGAPERTFVQNNLTGTTSTLTLGAGNASGTFGGVIRNNTTGTGIVTVTKIDNGTQTLSGANTYTGATLVLGGKLVVNGSLSAGTTTTVGTAGALGGTGTLNGAVTIDGTHSPGNSAGVQTMAAGVTYGITSTLEWELAANTATLGAGPVNYDQVQVTGGTLTVASGAEVDLIFNMAGSAVDFTSGFWTTEQDWLVVALSGGATSGSPNNAFTIDSISLDSNGISHTGFGNFSTSVDLNGNQLLSWTPVPEPGSAAFALLGGLFLIRRRR